MADKVCSFCNTTEGRMVRSEDKANYICFECVVKASSVAEVSDITAPDKKVIRPKCFNKEAR